MCAVQEGATTTSGKFMPRFILVCVVSIMVEISGYIDINFGFLLMYTLFHKGDIVMTGVSG